MSMYPTAIIFQPTKTAMQSGRGKTQHWVLEFTRPAPATPDALMGWNSMNDTRTQVKLTFATQAEAEAYATAKNISFKVKQSHSASVAPKAYAENFASHKRSAHDASS